jgi:hypothetical protein
MLRFLKSSALAVTLITSFAITTLAGSSVSAVSDDWWRDWDEMESAGGAVTYGNQLDIYACFNGVFRVSIQARNSRGTWQNMQTVTTKKSKRCPGKKFRYAALFNGRVTVLGQQLDDGLYLEMRLSSAATKGYNAYRSPPVLFQQYKSNSDKMRQICESIDRMLDKLNR